MTRSRLPVHLFASAAILTMALAIVSVPLNKTAARAPAPTPAPAAAQAPAPDPMADHKAAITKKAQAFVETFHKGDANALAAFWIADGDYADIAGRTVKGRQALAEAFVEFFAEHKNHTLAIEVLSIRFPAPDTAIEDGVTTVMSPDGGVPSRARYTNIWVKKDHDWQLASVRETPYIPPNNGQFLQPLDWIIGEWAEDTKEPHVGRVMFEWTPDKNFIIGLRAVAVKDVLLDNGSQRIGWDPAAKLIRSWSFEADGGFGHGSWKKDGDKWLIAMSHVLRTGSLMTGTTIIKRLDPDTISVQLTEQQLDGKPVADSPVIKMKRQK